MTRDEEIMHLIENNLDLIPMQSSRFKMFEWACRDDLESEGFLGLRKAAEKFDIARGIPFRAFAPLYIRQKMWAYLRQFHAVSVPERMGRNRPSSQWIESPLGSDDGLTLQDTIEDTRAEEPRDRQLYLLIRAALHGMEPKQRELIERRYEFNGYERCTWKQIGRAQNITGSGAQSNFVAAMKILQRKVKRALMKRWTRPL